MMYSPVSMFILARPVYQVNDWSRNPSTMDVGCFYGGDLQGVWDKLDYIRALE